MGFLKLSNISETDNFIKLQCPMCKGLFTIEKKGLTPINEGFEIKSSFGQICPNCSRTYFHITSNQTEIKSNEEFIEIPLKPTKRPFFTFSPNNGCGTLIGSVILFILIVLMAKGCNVNKSIIPDSYFKPGGGGNEQYQKDVKDGEYIYKLNQELEKQKR